MIIGIDASRAFIKNRTGIEEYAYQAIKHLIPLLKDNWVVLYIRKSQNANLNLACRQAGMKNDNVKCKIINLPYLWTQIGLSLEMLLHPVDVLFVPAHIVPIIHPKNTIVTIHGLEYEFVPKAYSFLARLYMRWSIKNSCRWAKKIIAVSNNTKQDLMKLYKVPEEKIEVVYEGCDTQVQSSKFKVQSENTKYQIPNTKYLLFIGRLEERKNIVGIIKSFEILKEEYKLPHQLILAGNFGYGKEKIINVINNSNFRKDIILPGYVNNEKKWKLLKNADVFLFPTFYEGFGLPVLEAQSVGVPVIAGNNSSIPELIEVSPRIRSRGETSEYSAILVDPKNAEQIADAAYKLISDKSLRDDIIKKGYENVKRFSWEKCAEEIAKILTSK